MSTKKFKSGLVILIIIIVFVIGFSIFCLLNPEFYLLRNRRKTDSYTPNGKIIGKKESKNFLATVYVQGTIEEANNSYNQEWLLTTIDQLAQNENNVGIILYVDSPGGGVYQADEVYLALLDYKNTGKKIYVYMGPLAASGGYYISCAADGIFANRNTLTGSIGVISGQTFDLTELFEKTGIKSETIHAGKNKNMGNYNEPFTDEQRAILQSVADECYEQFVNIVAEGRNLSVEEVKKLADGRIYTAKQALDLGLIDGIKNWNDVIATAKYNTTGNSTYIREYKYEHKQTFAEMMLYGYSKIADKQAASKLGLPETVMNDINGFNTYPAYIYK